MTQKGRVHLRLSNVRDIICILDLISLGCCLHDHSVDINFKAFKSRFKRIVLLGDMSTFHLTG